MSILTDEDRLKLKNKQERVWYAFHGKINQLVEYYREIQGTPNDYVDYYLFYHSMHSNDCGKLVKYLKITTENELSSITQQCVRWEYEKFKRDDLIVNYLELLDSICKKITSNGYLIKINYMSRDCEKYYTDKELDAIRILHKYNLLKDDSIKALNNSIVFEEEKKNRL